MKKHTPATAVVIDCSDDVFVADQQQLLSDLNASVQAGDHEAARAAMDELDKLLGDKPARAKETRVKLAGADLENYHAIHVEGFTQKKAEVKAAVAKGLAATADQTLAAIENSQPVPKKLAAHRAHLRSLYGAIDAASSHEQLAAIEIPAPPA